MVVVLLVVVEGVVLFVVVVVVDFRGCGLVVWWLWSCGLVVVVLWSCGVVVEVLSKSHRTFTIDWMLWTLIQLRSVLPNSFMVLVRLWWWWW